MLYQGDDYRPLERGELKRILAGIFGCAAVADGVSFVGMGNLFREAAEVDERWVDDGGAPLPEPKDNEGEDQ